MYLFGPSSGYFWNPRARHGAGPRGSRFVLVAAPGEAAAASIGGVCYALAFPSLVSLCPGFVQRAWEVDVILSPLSPVVREALRPWLLLPTDPRRWPPPETFEERRSAISPEEADDQTRPTACRLLRQELKAIRQTLDMPPEALSGLTRNGLLAAHGLRLRQLERWLWPFYAAREIKRLIA